MSQDDRHFTDSVKTSVYHADGHYYVSLPQGNLRQALSGWSKWKAEREKEEQTSNNKQTHKNMISENSQQLPGVASQ